MNHKGYKGEATYDESIKMFSGKIVNAKAVGTFYGKTTDEIEQEFKNTVDEYLSFCTEKGIEPEKPFSGKFYLRIPMDLHRRIHFLSKEAGQSLNAWISEKLADVSRV